MRALLSMPSPRQCSRQRGWRGCHIGSFGIIRKSEKIQQNSSPWSPWTGIPNSVHVFVKVCAAFRVGMMGAAATCTGGMIGGIGSGTCNWGVAVRGASGLFFGSTGRPDSSCCFGAITHGVRPRAHPRDECSTLLAVPCATKDGPWSGRQQGRRERGNFAAWCFCGFAAAPEAGQVRCHHHGTPTVLCRRL